MMVSKLYSILFSTFWLLFILALEPNQKKAQTIYQYVMIVSIVCGIAFVPLVGKLADNVNPQIVLPLSCITRFLACVGFLFIKNPAHIFSYFISIMLVLGTLMEQVCNEAIMFRNAPREIRGVIFGVANAFGFLGQFIFAMVGGILFDTMGPKWPFLLVGACDFTLFVITASLGYCGVIVNDI